VLDDIAVWGVGACDAGRRVCAHLLANCNNALTNFLRQGRL
jgi:hypothetical protein